VSPSDRPLVWLQGEIKTPPFSQAGRIEAGYLLRLLQKGQPLGLPQSRPMPVVGPRCHEVRVRDAGADWRIMYRLDVDAVVILEVFSKKTRATPKTVIDACIRRLREYDRA
jgi:phage-related protein